MNADPTHLNIMSLRARKCSMVAGEGHASVRQIFFHARAQCANSAKGRPCVKKIRKSNSDVRLYSTVQYCTILYSTVQYIKSISIIKLHFFMQIVWFLARIDQQGKNFHSSLSKQYSNISSNHVIKLHFSQRNRMVFR